MSQFHHYKILWKRKFSKKEESLDVRCMNLQDVQRLLLKSYNVSPMTTDLMVIHFIAPDGSVKELFAHEPKVASKTETTEVPTDPSVIIDIRDILSKKKKDKPRVKLPIVVPPQEPKLPRTTAACGMYHAEQMR